MSGYPIPDALRVPISNALSRAASYEPGMQHHGKSAIFCERFDRQRVMLPPADPVYTEGTYWLVLSSRLPVSPVVLEEVAAAVAADLPHVVVEVPVGMSTEESAAAPFHLYIEERRGTRWWRRPAPQEAILAVTLAYARVLTAPGADF